MEVPKEEVPEEQAPKEEAPKREVQKKEVSKEKVPKKYWVVSAGLVLAALIGILPQMINKECPHMSIDIPPGHKIVAMPISPPQETVVGREEKKTHDKIPVSSTSTLSPQEEKLYYEAWNLKESGSYNKALRKLGRLLLVRSDYVKAYIMRGRIYLENLQQYQNALKDFREVLEIEPDNKYALYYLGLAHYYLGDLSQAINYNQKALDLDPDFIITVHQHAIYYGEYEKRLLQQLKKITREIPAPYGEDLKTIYQDLD